MFASRLLCAVVLVLLPSMLGRVGAAEPMTRVVHVSGEGVIRVIPDQVVIGMTITTIDDDLVKVRTDSDEQAKSVLSLAKKHGVTEDRFEVSRLELTLDYSEKLQRRIYQVDRDIAVTLHQLTKLDGLLSNLLDVPNLKISEITFGASKGRQHRLAALRRAVVDAREKAELLASLNGLKLGKANDITIDDESQSPFVISVIPVVGAADDGRQNGAGKRNRRAEPRQSRKGSKRLPSAKFVAFRAAVKQAPKQANAAAQKKPFALGLLEVTVSVSIDFELVVE